MWVPLLAACCMTAFVRPDTCGWCQGDTSVKVAARAAFSTTAPTLRRAIHPSFHLNDWASGRRPPAVSAFTLYTTRHHGTRPASHLSEGSWVATALLYVCSEYSYPSVKNAAWSRNARSDIGTLRASLSFAIRGTTANFSVGYRRSYNTAIYAATQHV